MAASKISLKIFFLVLILLGGIGCETEMFQGINSDSSDSPTNQEASDGGFEGSFRDGGADPQGTQAGSEGGASDLLGETGTTDEAQPDGKQMGGEYFIIYDYL